MIVRVIRSILLVLGWGLVLALDLMLNDDADCTGVPEGSECPWSASGDFWAFLIFGMAAVAILVLPPRRLIARSLLATTTFVAGAAILFL